MADDEKWGLSREEINERIEKQNQKHKKKGKGRSENQRLKLFYLLDYLLEETDETHTKKVAEIIEHFENYHKIPVEQKTVCSDLRLLGEYGYETQYDGRTRSWDCGRMIFRMLVYIATVAGRWEPSRTQRGTHTSLTNASKV